MVVMMQIHSEVLKLLDQKFDLVLFRIASHITKLFVFVAGYDLVNGSCDSICNRHLCFVGRA